MTSTQPDDHGKDRARGATAGAAAPLLSFKGRAVIDSEKHQLRLMDAQGPEKALPAEVSPDLLRRYGSKAIAEAFDGRRFRAAYGNCDVEEARTLTEPGCFEDAIAYVARGFSPARTHRQAGPKGPAYIPNGTPTTTEILFR